MSRRSKVYGRILAFSLGTLVLLSFIFLMKFVSSAQAARITGGNSSHSNDFQASLLQQTGVITATATLTPTATSTATPTDTPTLTPTPTETATPTATSTETSTPTQTNTPTVTRTSTVTPTNTAGPSPTVTGTLTIIPKLKVSVTPSQAKVNESFTFSIEVSNTGTGPTQNNVVVDTFPSYIDVVSVTTNHGSVTKLTHSFVVTVGDVAPNQVVTITALVKVNATLTRTETNSNEVTLTYDVSKSLTASAAYKVVFSTLPPTGELPLNWRESRINLSGMIPGVVILVVGLLLLVLGAWTRLQQQKNSLWMLVSGALFIIVGFIAAATALGAIKPAEQAHPSQASTDSNAIIAQLQPLEPSASSQPRLPAWRFSTPEAVVPWPTLPDYPIPTPEVTVTVQPGETGPDLSPVVRIAIPAILLDTDVKYVPYDGFSWLITGLREEVAWMGNTSWPGLGSNTSFAGHVTVSGLGDGPFRRLEELQSGEPVILYTEKNMYTYYVRESRVTDDGDMSVTFATTIPQISLITCVNWDQETRAYMNRLVVIADLVRTEPITMGSAP